MNLRIDDYLYNSEEELNLNFQDDYFFDMFRLLIKFYKTPSIKNIKIQIPRSFIHLQELNDLMNSLFVDYFGVIKDEYKIKEYSILKFETKDLLVEGEVNIIEEDYKEIIIIRK